MYNYIEEWWGEPLSPSLASTIAAAPWRHIKLFGEGWPDLSRLYRQGHLDKLPSGELRPVFGKRTIESEKAVATRLLLYVPSVAVDADMLNPLRPVVIGFQKGDQASRAAIRAGFLWLAATRPLVNEGSLLYTGKTRGSHPSLAGGYIRALKESPAMQSWDTSDYADIDPGQLTADVWELGGNIALAEEGAGTLLSLTRPEEATYHALLDGRRIEDARITKLTMFSRLSVPDFSGDVAKLVRLRQDSDAFQSVRDGLTRAMGAVKSLPDSDQSIKDAEDVLSYELQAALFTVAKEATASPALTTLRSGTRALGFTAVGSAVGAGVMAATGSPLTGAIAGLAGGVGTKASELVAAYVGGLKSRRSARAVWDVIMSFKPEGRT